MPFFVIAFLEGLALELIYFSPRRPLANLFNPVVRKFFGPAFVHYPGNLLVLPKLFYYAQIVVYIFIGVFLISIAVNIVKNIRQGLPLRTDALIKNATRNYLSFFVFGLVMIGCMLLVKKVDVFIFTKFLNLVSAHLPQVLLKLSPYILTLFLFFSNIILQTFLVLTIPIIVIEKSVALTALVKSISLGFRNFISIFALISLPFLVYLPIIILKTGAGTLASKTFPEINLYIAVLGIILTVFMECFIVVCATQFLLDKKQK
ncbi:MAG: hypothetical protein NG712_05570 [Omnitrophica bacterium]|nr:hypothetical protein [Candidatus Omnitrophota bacterium]